MKKIISHLNNGILNAETHNSKLSFELLSHPGQSSYKIRHLLNNIMELPDINYLEIGNYYGSTFIASLYKNKLNSAYAIDIKITDEFNAITKKLNLDFTKIECDSWKVDLSLIKHKINVYLYDGEHEESDQYKALEYYYPVLADEFIFLVDDWNSVNDHWAKAQNGTKNAIKDLNLKILYERELPFFDPGNRADEWWNGFYVALLKK